MCKTREKLILLFSTNICTNISSFSSELKKIKIKSLHAQAENADLLTEALQISSKTGGTSSSLSQSIKNKQ